MTGTLCADYRTYLEIYRWIIVRTKTNCRQKLGRESKHEFPFP